MAIVSINIKEGTLKKEDYIIGIDLGTTNSMVAIINKTSNSPEALKGEGKEAIVPSIIYLKEGEAPLVGDLARKKLTEDPANTIFSVKRLMGRSFKDVKEKASLLGYKIIDDNSEGLVKIQSGEKFYTPIELSSFILKELKRVAEISLQSEISKAVITVPAYFNDAQRQATRDAGKLAGLDVLRIVNEPTAASLAYGIGLNPDDERTIAVYDLGGGTFDISTLKIHNGLFEVLSTHGDTHLGGDDFDKAIVHYWLDHILGSNVAGTMDSIQLQRMRLIAEEAKKYLSFNQIYESDFEIDDKTVRLKLSRDEFNQCISGTVQRTIASCNQALKDAGLQKGDLDEVILVGGSTRVPLVKEAVKQFFEVQTLHDQLNPDEVVALGAAVEADILAGNRKDILLLDVTPLSLGIETLGELMDVIIPRNSKVPQRASRQYTTSKDGQISLRVSIYQGERDQVQHNRKLGEFHLQGIPAMPAGLPKIEITFMLDADGILKVSAKELRSGVEQKIVVKPQYGLTDEELEKMLLDSLQNAKQDMGFRSLQEARVEAEQLIYASQRFIEKNKDAISQEEIEETNKCIDLLNRSLNSNNKDEILKAHEQLNHITQPFAERLMDQAISKSIKGKSIANE